jgi:hypothetical protein
MIPQLVTLSGGDTLRQYLDESDYRKLVSGRYTRQDLEDMADSYPELMGFLPLVPVLTTAASKIAKSRGVNKALAKIDPTKKKGGKKPSAAVAPVEAATAAPASNNLLMYAGLGAGALLLMSMLKKKKRR